MKKCSDPSGFFAKSTGAAHGDKDGWIAPDLRNSLGFFIISNYS